MYLTRLTVETIVVCVCPHLPLDERIARQRRQHNVIHNGIRCPPLPLASRLANERRMGDKAYAMDNIPQLALGIHCLGNPTDVTQREFALRPYAPLNDCHAARHQRNLARDVSDVANLQRYSIVVGGLEPTEQLSGERGPGCAVLCCVCPLLPLANSLSVSLSLSLSLSHPRRLTVWTNIGWRPM